MDINMARKKPEDEFRDDLRVFTSRVRDMFGLEQPRSVSLNIGESL
jgi:hypothetical protein